MCRVDQEAPVHICLPRESVNGGVKVRRVFGWLWLAAYVVQKMGARGMRKIFDLVACMQCEDQYSTQHEFGSLSSDATE